MNADGLSEHVCGMCKKRIRLFVPHVAMLIGMLDGSSDSRRYCGACCEDPATAVLLGDVMRMPVQGIAITKVWA